MIDLPNEKKVTRTLIVKKGHKKIIKLALDEIYTPISDTDSANNIARLYLDKPNIDTLQPALMNPDWSLPLMVVEFIKGGLNKDGKTYFYKLVAGYHRMSALKRQHQPNWLFDLYEFDSEEERITYQALENDHTPRKKLGVEDWANYLSYKLSKKWVVTENDLIKEMDQFPHVHPSTKTAAISRAMSKNGVHQDFVIRDWQEIQKFTKNLDNYSEGDVYTNQGNLDLGRNEHGWTVKEGYEREFIMSAIKKYHDTEKPSYFVNWVKTPNDKSPSADEKRALMSENYQKLETALMTTFEYYKEHGTWPWRQEAWFPQDNTAGENKFIKI